LLTHGCAVGWNPVAAAAAEILPCHRVSEETKWGQASLKEILKPGLFDFGR
jgi:hypothetical protein